jgi:hypothetical protein
MKKIVFFFLALLPAVALAEAGKDAENTVGFLTGPDTEKSKAHHLHREENLFLGKC